MSDEFDESEEGAETEPAQPAKKAKKPKKPKEPKKPKAPKPPKVPGEKKKGFNLLLLLVPVALVGAFVLAYILPPTHAMLVNGPLKPLLARFEKTPPHGALAARVQQTPDPAVEVKRLNEALDTGRRAAAAKDAQISGLQTELTQLQAQPKSTPAPAVKPTPEVVSDEVKRAATYWAGMDADKAADIVKLLPDPYVKGVFSQMPPDAVADIMSALPAKTAARLTSSAP